MSSIATLIPAYNAATHIRAALDSVAAQTRVPDQIVVVDDGSTDQTAEVVTTWAGRHPHLPLKLVRQANGGASSARNAAILAATTDLIAFLDSDDLYEPRHHARLAAALDAHPEIVAVFGKQSVFNEHGELCDDFLRGKPIEDVGRAELPGQVHRLSEGLWSALIRGNFIPTSGSMTRRQTVIDAGLFDTSLRTSEDRDLWLRVSRRGALAYIPERLARKREHADNLTSDANRPLVNRYALEVVRKQLDHADALGLTNDELDATQTALTEAAGIMLYSASRDGLGPYRAARQRVRELAPDALHIDVRGWVRALSHALHGH